MLSRLILKARKSSRPASPSPQPPKNEASQACPKIEINDVPLASAPVAPESSMRRLADLPSYVTEKSALYVNTGKESPEFRQIAGHLATFCADPRRTDGRRNSVDTLTMDLLAVEIFEGYSASVRYRIANERNEQSVQLVHLACLFNAPKLLQLLLQHVATNLNGCLELVDWRLLDPTHYAAVGNSVEALKVIQQHPIDVSSTDSKGWTALHYACAHLSVDVVNFLVLEMSIRPTADHTGWTPLHVVAVQVKDSDEFPGVELEKLQQIVDVLISSDLSVATMRLTSLFQGDQTAEELANQFGCKMAAEAIRNATRSFITNASNSPDFLLPHFDNLSEHSSGNSTLAHGLATPLLSGHVGSPRLPLPFDFQSDLLNSEFAATNLSQNVPLSTAASSTDDQAISASCCVCFDAPKNCAVKPCWHVATCMGCSERVQSCPICRGPINGRQKVNIS